MELILGVFLTCVEKMEFLITNDTNKNEFPNINKTFV